MSELTVSEPAAAQARRLGRSLVAGYPSAVVGARWWVLAVLAAVTVAATQLLPGLAVVGGGLSGLVSADNPTITAQVESFERFGLPLLSRTAVVQRDPEGLDVNVQVDSVLRAL